MNRLMVMSLVSLAFSCFAFSETYYEKAETAFMSASKLKLSELPEVPEFQHTECVVKRFPNRIAQSPFKIIKSEDGVIGESARITIDNLSVTISEMSDGDLGYVDVSSNGYVLGRSTIRILRDSKKNTFILRQMEVGGNEPLSTYCWW